jgi:two-component system response regulator YesN
MKGIYCIDDDQLITEILKYQLAVHLDSEKFSVECLNDPLSVIDTIKEAATKGVEPVICIIDFQMPFLRGDELTRLLKDEYPEVKIIMLSGNSNAILVSDLEEEGMLDFYLSKPWSKDQLLSRINDCLPLNLKFA